MRPLLRDFLVYGLSDGALRATALLALPLYTRAFTPGEYGVWSTLTTVSLLVSALLILGGDSAFARLWFDSDDRRHHARLTSTWLAFLALVTVAAFGIVLVAAPALTRIAVGPANSPWLLVAAVSAAPLSVLGAIAGQALRNQYRASTLAWHNGLAASLSLGLGLTAVFTLEWGVLGVFAAHAAALALVLPLRLLAIRDLLVLDLSPRLLRGLLSFGIPLVPTTVAYWVFNSSDRLLLARLADLHQVGLYSVAATLTGVLAIAHSALGQAWSPRALAAYRADPEGARRYFGRVALVIVAGFGMLAVVGTVFADGGIRLLASDRYAEARYAVAPLALAGVALATTQVTATGISLHKKTYLFAAYAWVAALLNLVLNLLFIPRYGLIAAAWTTTVSYVFLTMAYHLTTQRMWRVHYPRVRMPLALASVVAFTTAAPALPAGPALPALALKVVYVLAFLALLFGITLGPRLVRFLRTPRGSTARRADADAAPAEVV